MGVAGTRSARTAGAAVTIASAMAIGWLTLGPGQTGMPAVTGRIYLLTDIVLNVLLFMPLGVGLALLGIRVRSALVIGTLASVAIELSQRWIPGRTASVYDILTNGLGTAFGAILVAAWDDRARWRKVAGVPLALVIATAWLLGGVLGSPSLPPGARWWGQWKHEFAGTTLFPGAVLSLMVQGMAIPDGLIAGTTELREGLSRSDTLRLEAGIIPGGPVEGRAQLVGIVSEEGGELASLWQTGTSVLARQRLRLSDLSLRTLWLRMDEVLSTPPGDTVRLVLQATRRAVELRVGHGGTWKVTRRSLGPEIFWTGFLPFEYQAGGGGLPWPAIGSAMIFLVLGFLLAPNWAVAVATLGILLLLAPVIERSALPGLETMLAAVGGLGAGSWLSRRLKLAPSNRAVE
jgi:hypothetical protein